MQINKTQANDNKQVHVDNTLSLKLVYNKPIIFSPKMGLFPNLQNV